MPKLVTENWFATAETVYPVCVVTQVVVMLGGLAKVTPEGKVSWKPRLVLAAESALET